MFSEPVRRSDLLPTAHNIVLLKYLQSFTSESCTWNGLRSYSECLCIPVPGTGTEITQKQDSLRALFKPTRSYYTGIV